MPYIKQEQRLPEINHAINDFLDGILSAPEWAEILENALTESNIPSEKWDGIINYALTQLLLCSKKEQKIPSKLKSPIEMIFYRTYIQLFEEHGYVGRERFLGLLYCMRAEFDRRKWSNHIWFLTQQLRRYTILLGVYERSKLEKNGDLLK
jgi:hypothetical protein